MKGSPFQRNFGVGSTASPAKLTAEWIELPDGTKTQVSRKDVNDHKKALTKAEFAANEPGRDASINPPTGNEGAFGMPPSEFMKTDEGKRIQAERNQAIVDLGKTTTTGKESMDALEDEMNADDRQRYGGPGHENYQAKYPKRATAWEKAVQESIDEKDSGVAANQDALNQASWDNRNK